MDKRKPSLLAGWLRINRKRRFKMKEGLRPGLTHEVTLKVESDMTAQKVYEKTPDVFATIWLVGFFERTCCELIEPYLDDGESSVGTKVDITHIAPTPIGFNVRVKAVLKEIDRRRLVFNVEAYDDMEKIGEGTHERFVIDKAKFMNKVKEKSSRGA